MSINILDNFGKEKGWMTYGVQVLFFILFVIATPYNFFPGKLCVINLIQEYQHACFSKVLSKRIDKKQGANNNSIDDYLKADLATATDNEDGPPEEAAAAGEVNQNEEEEVDVMEITDDKTHNIIVISYSVSIAFVAMLTNDLSLILGLYSSFCECFMDFFLPPVLVYCALKGLHKPCVKIGAVTWGILGVIYWTTAQYYNLKKMHAI